MKNFGILSVINDYKTKKVAVDIILDMNITRFGLAFTWLWISNTKFRYVWFKNWFKTKKFTFNEKLQISIYASMQSIQQKSIFRGTSKYALN